MKNPSAMSAPPEASAPAREAAPRGFANPSVQLGISIVLSAVAQLLLKRGAGSEAEAGVFGIEGLRSGWVWLGIGALIGSLFSWLAALRSVSLSLATALAGAIHFLVPIGSWLWLNEGISPQRWLGILLVLIGVVVSARPAMAVEEKL